VQHRLIEAAASIVENDESELCFQHTVFCQTGLPYRDPGDAFPPCYGHRDRLRIAKGRGRLAARPPPAYEASRNLTAPETGRASGLCPHRRPQPPPLRPDLATRHPRQPGIDTRLRMIAQRDGLMIVEVLERALNAMNALVAPPDDS
jgi:hypothetical protein